MQFSKIFNTSRGHVNAGYWLKMTWYIQKCERAYKHMNIDTNTHSHTRTHTHAHPNTHVHTLTLTHKHSPTFTNIHQYSYTHTHSLINTYTHSPPPPHTHTDTPMIIKKSWLCLAIFLFCDIDLKVGLLFNVQLQNANIIKSKL